MLDPTARDALTAAMFGATIDGHTELTGLHPSIARDNQQSHAQQAGQFAVAHRDRDANLRLLLLPTPTVTVRILTAGDSITVGYGSADNQGYRPWLTDLIEQQNIRPCMAMHAHGGWTLADATPGLADALAATTPDIVLINLGTNEWIPDLAAQTAYQAAYGQMLDQILATSPTVRVACALSPITQVPSIQATQARAHVAIQGAVADRVGTGRVALSDQRRTTSAEWTAHATDGSAPPPGRWTFDGVHPTDAGYLRMAEAWMTTLRAACWIPGLT